MKTVVFVREQFIRRPRASVFSFYADARNLDRVTPSWLHFRMMTPGPVTMAKGTRIDYRLRVHGLPIRWTSEITEWSPPDRFVDVQVRGPYLLWEHTHEFFEMSGGTVVRDAVKYALPMRWLGDLIQRRFVEKDLARIFDFRREALTAAFENTTDFADPPRVVVAQKD